MSAKAPSLPPSTEARPAWKEPMVWLVFGIPAATIVAGVYTIYLTLSVDLTDVPNLERVGKSPPVTRTAPP